MVNMAQTMIITHIESVTSVSTTIIHDFCSNTHKHSIDRSLLKYLLNSKQVSNCY